MELQWFHWTLLSALAIAMLLAWHVPRAPGWLALGALFYIASASWHNIGLPYGVFFGAATNFAMIGLLWVFADQRWEMRLWNFFHVMLLIDALYLFRIINDKFIFAASLELVNLLAMLFVAGTGVAERYDGSRDGRDSIGWAGNFYRSLFAPRDLAYAPWWRR
jgi:hypothetical protein